jgi:hypothetical protein
MTMTLEDFRRLAETWGADIGRWPPESRAPARRLAGTPAAAHVLAEAARLDALMAARPPVSRARAERAAHAVALRLAADGGGRAVGLWRRLSSGWLVPAASIACSALIGISLAMALPSPDDGQIVLGMIFDSGSMAAGWALQ